MVRYFLEVNLVWAVFLLVYTVFLRRETYFHINRWYLLASLVAGLLLPLIPWPAIWPATTEEVLMPIYIVEPGDYVLKLEEPTPVFDWQRLLLIAYTLFVCFGIGRLGVGCWKLWKWFQQAERIVHPAFVMVLTSFYHLPFSFFHFLYRSKLQHLTPQEEQMMIWHEEAHIQNRHSLDRLLAEVVTTVFWLSPLPYVYRYLIILNHEYEADAAVLAKTSRKQYGQLLLQQSLSGPAPALVHSFFQLPIKNRIRMMLQHPSTRKARLKLLLALPLLAGLALAFAPRKSIETAKSTIQEMTDSVDTIPDKKAQVLSREMIEEYNAGNLEITIDGKKVDIQTVEELPTSKIATVNISSKEETKSAETSTTKSRLEIMTKANQEVNAVNEIIPSSSISPNVLYIVDRNVWSQKEVNELDPSRIKTVNVFKGEKAIEKYGEKAKNGVVVITTDLKEYLLIDGEEYTESRMKALGGPDSIFEIATIPGKIATKKYGEKAKDGSVEFISIKNARRDPDDHVIYKHKVVDEMPRFPGCEGAESKSCSDKKLLEYIYANIKYPKQLRDANVSGKVIAEFQIDKTGTLKDISIKQGAHPSMDAEVKRVIQQMVADGIRWTPGIRNGKIVNVDMVIPVEFKLSNEPRIIKKEASDKPKNEQERVVVNHNRDDMPRFPGCEDEKDEDKKLQCAQTALFTYLANNLVYPKSAIVQNLEGMVVASFVVRKDGSLDNISIAKSLNPDFDAEVIRVIKSMPNWIPSPQADIEMKLPVRFKKPDTQSTDTETTTKTPDNILEISNYRANLSTRGKLDLSFSATKGNTEVLVSTLDGKAVFQKTYKGFNGQFRESITLPSNLAANAVLVVSVRQGSKQNTRKVVVP